MKKLVVGLVGLVMVGGLMGCGGAVKTTTTRELAKQPSPCDPATEYDTLIDTGELQDPALQSEAYKNRPATVVYFVDDAGRCVPMGGGEE